MLSVVEKACVVEPDHSKAIIVLESDHAQPEFSQAHEELADVEARRFAIVTATKLGLSKANLTATPVIFPVNAKGQALDEVRGPDGAPLPPTHPDMQPHRYRVTVKLINGPR